MRTIPALIVIALAITGCESSDSGSDVGSSDGRQALSEVEKAARNLAIIESDGSPDSTLQGQFENLLVKLDEKCGPLAPSRLADYAVNTQGTLRKNGEDESLSSIMSNVVDSIPGPAEGKLKCSNVFVTYTIVRVEEG